MAKVKKHSKKIRDFNFSKARKRKAGPLKSKKAAKELKSFNQIVNDFLKELDNCHCDRCLEEDGKCEKLHDFMP